MAGPDFCPRSSTARLIATGNGNLSTHATNSSSRAFKTSDEARSAIWRASAAKSSGTAQAEPEIMPSAPARSARAAVRSAPLKSANGPLAFECEKLLEILPVAARILDAGKAAAVESICARCQFRV